MRDMHRRESYYVVEWEHTDGTFQTSHNIRTRREALAYAKGIEHSAPHVGYIKLRTVQLVFLVDRREAEQLVMDAEPVCAVCHESKPAYRNTRDQSLWCPACVVKRDRVMTPLSVFERATA